jgi:hypothetical protein
MKMRWAIVWVLGSVSAWGQMCAPARMLPSGAVSGTLDNSSCQLSDATAYAAYRLDLPVRGRIALDLSTASDFILLLRDATGAKVDSGMSIHRPVEAGSYAVLVDARIPGQAGAYAVKTGFTAEPGMWCAAFPSLGLNQTAAGALGSSGCMRPDGTAYEGYWLNTYGAGTLTVAVTSGDFTPAVIVRSSDGAAVASGQGSVSAAVDAGSRYQVVVTTTDSTGAYQIATSFQLAAGETCTAVETLAGAISDTGAVTGTSCTAPLAGGGDLSYYNYYNLTVASAGVADIAVSSSDFLPALYLLDDGGNVVAIDSGGGAAAAPALASEIRMQLQPGNYTVQLVSSVASGGAYRMSYQFTAGGPQPCAAGSMNPGDSPAGTLSAASCRTGLGLGDQYAVTLPSAGTLQATVSSDSAAPAVALRDAKENLIVMNQDVEGLGVTHISADLPAGMYTMVAAAAAGAGAYQLASQFAAHALTPCPAPQTLALNGGYVWKLGVGGCAGASGQPADLYQFTLPSDGVIAGIITSSDVDGYLTLTDASGNVLRSDDNSYAGADPMIVQYLPAGTYGLAARAAGSSAGGYYRLDLLNSAGSRPAFCGALGALAPGVSVTGTIGFASCDYIDGAFADIYSFQLASSASVDLQLNSTDFDAYLVLLDSQGNLVDRDDDSGGGTNAHITRLLGAGTYYVVAKPNGDHSNGGNYTLSLNTQ